MAVLKVFIIYCCLIVIFLGDVDGKRGGGGSRGSSRGSSSRGGISGRSRVSYGGSSRISRTFSHVPLSGRIIAGSSIYTALTWRSAASRNYIYGGPVYITRYPHRHDLPPICTNNYEKSPEGRVYGYFICPREQENSTYIYCCGAEKREYCCDMAMAQEYFSTSRDYLAHRKKSGTPVVAIICISLGIICVAGIGVFCCVKRKKAGVVIRHFSKKSSSQQQDICLHPSNVQIPQDTTKHTDTGVHEVPLNGPTPAYDGICPGVQPPPYDAITPPHPGYDGSGDLQYGPPQPQPPSYFDERSGLPTQDVDRTSQPYWAPYPPTSGDFSYPPSNKAPYPSEDDMPYPPPSSASYPSMGGAPYPPVDGVPYPPMSGTPYPPMDGTPYPNQQPTSGPSIASAPTIDTVK